MTNVLDRIKAYKLEEIAAAKARMPLAEVEAAAREARAPRLRFLATARRSSCYTTVAHWAASEMAGMCGMLLFYRGETR